MNLSGFRALLTPEGQAMLAEAAHADLSQSGDTLLATASRLRERYPTELVAAALTQVRLRARAYGKFGPDAARMYFTPAGLEQATRANVAAHRARRFTSPTLDLCCGIGGDLIARARAGCHEVGVDKDPLTVAVAGANIEALGLSEFATVREGDATQTDPEGYAALFADPGRRTARGRVFDPRAYQPPLDVVLALAARTPGACVKVAPGIPHAAIPRRAEAEWISAGGEVKEAAIWLGELAGEAVRRATLLPRGTDHTSEAVATLVADPGLDDPPVGPWRRYLYEPDGAVVRAHLVAEVAADIAGNLADPHIAYITADTLKSTPFATAYEIRDALPFSVKRLRSALRERHVGTLTIKKRGSAVDIERLRRDLRPQGPERATVVLTRVGTSPVALICRPA